MTAPTYEGQDLPLPIQRAIARTMDPELPIALSASERMALAALLRRVEARDGSREFWVRRCNLAATFDCVERTIGNWLAALEAKGLIVKEQGRTRWGNFKSLTLQLTGTAIALLGLEQRGRPELSTAQGKNFSSGHKREFYLEQSPSERHSATPDLSTVQKAQTANSRIPEDCSQLLVAGLAPPAIFKLMATARIHGKRLGDLVKARGAAIASARHPYSFALKLAKDGIDYAALMVQEQTRASKKVEAAVQKAHKDNQMDGAMRSSVGKQFNIGHGRVAHVYDGYVEVMEGLGKAARRLGCLGGASLTDFWHGVAKGTLVPTSS